MNDVQNAKMKELLTKMVKTCDPCAVDRFSITYKFETMTVVVYRSSGSDYGEFDTISMDYTAHSNNEFRDTYRISIYPGNGVNPTHYRPKLTDSEIFEISTIHAKKLEDYQSMLLTKAMSIVDLNGHKGPFDELF